MHFGGGRLEFAVSRVRFLSFCPRTQAWEQLAPGRRPPASAVQEKKDSGVWLGNGKFCPVG